ncbi:hypothetical protein [Actinoplanes sp. NPDC049599]|uniref:hypothetical protein n=1 Tax=Actinoplanes sp. NPDC049599 TaxID=3363903 RepID=UPI0037A3ECB4
MADSSWWVPLVSGAMGVAGALGGTWLTQHRSNQRDEQNWQRQRADRLRDTRGQLYLDLMEYLENLFNQLTTDDDDVRNLGSIPEVPPRERLTVRVDLYGSEVLREAWSEALLRYDMIAAERQDNGIEEVSKETVQAAVTAIVEAQKLLRQLAIDVLS